MSTERVSFGFNSLIPETYKTKAEAFARCLQHKLLSLGKADASPNSYGDSKRLSEKERQNDSAVSAEKSTDFFEGWSTSASADRLTDKTDGSDEEFCSHSESENGHRSEPKGPSDRRKHKLTSLSSEDSTVESWSSCQDNLTDFEKLDSENEEVNNFASQIKGSPKIKSFNMRTKRKELREKSWKRNSRKNHSSSTESIDSESVKEMPKLENFDSESDSRYILLGPDDDEVPHRILRESSSTSSLEKHFSYRETVPSPVANESRLEKDATSPDGKSASEESEEAHFDGRLHFAEIESDFEEIQFVEVESMKEFGTNDVTKCVKRIGGMVVECSDDSSSAETSEDWCCEGLTITSVEVLDHGEPEKKPDEPKSRNAPQSLDQADSVIERPEDDEILNSRSKMRRCSSLKTWKTPPGTPGAKKIVRFADALGLDLADVRTFLDEIPKIPSSAFDDLHFELTQTEQFLPPPPPASTLAPLFQQPGTKMDFLERVQNQKICLESAIVSDVGVLTVAGYVRVRNVSFHKSVHVRYSLNGWRSFSDLQASYVPNSCDGFSDKFSFVLYGHTLKIGEKLEFALRLECCGTQFWDNNGGINYAFNCLPHTSASRFFSPHATGQTDPWFDFY